MGTVGIKSDQLATELEIYLDSMVGKCSSTRHLRKTERGSKHHKEQWGLAEVRWGQGQENDHFTGRMGIDGVNGEQTQSAEIAGGVNIWQSFWRREKGQEEPSTCDVWLIFQQCLKTLAVSGCWLHPCKKLQGWEGELHPRAMHLKKTNTEASMQPHPSEAISKHSEEDKNSSPCLLRRTKSRNNAEDNRPWCTEISTLG